MTDNNEAIHDFTFDPDKMREFPTLELPVASLIEHCKFHQAADFVCHASPWKLEFESDAVEPQRTWMRHFYVFYKGQYLNWYSAVADEDDTETRDYYKGKLDARLGVGGGAASTYTTHNSLAFQVSLDEVDSSASEVITSHLHAVFRMQEIITEAEND